MGLTTVQRDCAACDEAAEQSDILKCRINILSLPYFLDDCQRVRLKGLMSGSVLCYTSDEA